MLKRFLYYLPGVPGVSEQSLANLGLRSRFASCEHAGLIEHSVSQVEDGPKGRGCIVARGHPAEYSPERQIWTEGEVFWVGYEKGMAPGPEDLAREVGHAGYPIILADEREWRAPRLWSWDRAQCCHTPNLPRAFAKKNGRMVLIVRPEFKQYDDLAGWVWDAYLAETTLPLDRLVENCATLLGMNYRLGVEEILALGLLDESHALNMCLLCIDYPEIQEHRKELAGQGLHVDEGLSNG